MFHSNVERKDVDDQTQCRTASFAFRATAIGGPEVWTAGFRPELPTRAGSSNTSPSESSQKRDPTSRKDATSSDDSD